MAQVVSLTASPRTELGKGPARRARAAGNIPAVIYGHGTEPQHVTVKNLEFLAGLRAEGVNAVFELNIDGESQLTLVKAIAQNPVTRIVEHIDLLIVRKGEKVEVNVPLRVEGEPISGSLLNVEFDEIRVLADALDIPEEFTISVEGAEIGTRIHASDIELPAGVELVEDPETLIVNITEPSAEEAGETEASAAAEAETGATAGDTAAE